MIENRELGVVKNDEDSFQWASEAYKNDREFMFEAVKINELSLQWASKSIQNDKEFLLNCVSQN